MLNWTAIFDEHHDFERNVRDVSGGLGAITSAANLADCGQLDKETQVDLKPGGVAIGGLQQPLKELADAATGCQHKDWDDIENYVKTIVPVHAKRATDPAAVTRGRQLFVDGNCAKCHGGSGWTASRRFYIPSSANQSALATATFTRPTFFPTTVDVRQRREPAHADLGATRDREPGCHGSGGARPACRDRTIGVRVAQRRHVRCPRRCERHRCARASAS